MPEYFFDTTPPLLDVGRGSPTGVTFYQGDQFPQEYDDAFLACDWSQGRILAVKSQRSGGTYRATASDLVTGQPLNCTDIEVGPDGAVYFTTGGRGTLGGLFRVTFGAPAEAPTHSDAVTAAVLAPSPLSSFTRKAVMDAKARAGADWTTKLIHEHALNPQKPASMRVRALDLLNETGDATQAQALSQVCLAAAKDADPQVRAKAVQILGQVRDEQARAAVRAALEDTDAFVVRRAAESLVRQAGEIPVEALLPVLAHPDRFVRYAARVGLEHADLSKHQSAILRLENPRAALEGLLALARATKLDTGAQGSLFRRQLELLQASLPPAEQLDLLRLIGVTYLRGPEGNKSALDLVSPALRSQLLPRLAPIGPNEALSPDLQRETARLLAFLDEPQAVPKILTAQAAAVAADDRATALFYAYCLRAMKNGWTPESKQRFWRFLDTASQWEGGFSYLGYLDFMTQDLLPHFSSEERATLLETAATSPFPARLLVRGLEVDSDPALVATLAGVVTRLDPAKNPNAVMELKNLVVEKLGQSKARIDSAHEVLRTIAKSDPGRRDLVARALAASPQEADLPVLVAALESRDENTINTVLEALAKIDKAPAGPEGLRNLIRLARRRTGKIADRFPALALKWKPANLTRPVPTFEGVDPAIAFWSEVYRSAYNDTPALEDASVRAAYTLAGLTKDVVENGRFRDGSAERGKQAITKGRCLECHKFGNEGQGLGPDLTTVSSRFQPAEILESMIVPSKVISDQYKSTQVALSDGKILIGMPAGGDDKTLVLLLSDSTKVTIQKEQIEEQGESKISVMPDGLLDLLTVEEIADMLKLFDVQPRVEVKPGG
jgi:putative heme-binding domain-containing protein